MGPAIPPTPLYHKPVIRCSGLWCVIGWLLLAALIGLLIALNPGG